MNIEIAADTKILVAGWALVAARPGNNQSMMRVRTTDDAYQTKSDNVLRYNYEKKSNITSEYISVAITANSRGKLQFRIVARLGSYPKQKDMLTSKDLAVLPRTSRCMASTRPICWSFSSFSEISNFYTAGSRPPVIVLVLQPHNRDWSSKLTA